MSAAIHTDAELVGASLAGNRDAFGKIVARYQSLVCSLAYSATGSLSQSEDLAQETFVAAWKQLAGLREPEKLRAWLCGIARNITSNSLRKQGREPRHRAESLDEISESHSPEPQPVEQTISNEERAILWRSLERIPEICREPLVLFYREHQSIEAVAQNLELTEDAVKQRLSRGRKMLQEQVLAFVEGALEQTNPGKVFTLGVLAALPLFAASVSAATAGVTAAKGSTGAKVATAFAKILLMTNTTKTTIVAAVAIAAVVTPVVVHHYRASASWKHPATYSVNKPVSAFPSREDLTTPEAAYATIQRAYVAEGNAAFERLNVPRLRQGLRRSQSLAGPSTAPFQPLSSERAEMWSLARKSLRCISSPKQTLPSLPECTIPIATESTSDGWSCKRRRDVG